MFVMDWMSPVRRNKDGLLLPPIPNEIYLEIFSYLKPDSSEHWIGNKFRRQFNFLALVCRFFCSVTLPWSFESLVFGADSDGDKAYIKFCRNILDREPASLAVANHVKRCAFIQSRSRSTVAFYDLCFDAMADMPNISEIYVRGGYYNEKLLKRIVKLPQLEELSFVSISNGSSQTSNIERLVKKFKNLRLKSLALSEIALSDEILCDVSTGSFRRLVLKRLLFQETFFDHASFPQLEELELTNIDGISANDVVAVLLKCPVLTHLCLKYGEIHNGPSIIPPECVPLLKSIEGPYSWCKKLVKGRPVSTLKILDTKDDFPGQYIRCYKSSTVELQHLQINCLSCPSEFYALLSEHFPNLRVLAFDALDPVARNDNLSTARACLKRARHPNLQELLCVNVPAYLHLKLSPPPLEHCPSLRQVRIVPTRQPPDEVMVYERHKDGRQDKWLSRVQYPVTNTHIYA